MKTCRLCGAVYSGNITCYTCRKGMSFLSDETRKAFKNCEIGCPVGLTEDSKYYRNIKRYNDRNKRQLSNNAR